MRIAKWPSRACRRYDVAGAALGASGLRERRPGVVARLGRQRVELRRSHRVHPWPSVAAAGVEEGRLVGQVERVRERVVGDGRIPFHRVGDVVEVAVAKRGGGHPGVGRVGLHRIPAQHPDARLANVEGGLVDPSAHLSEAPSTLPMKDIQ